MGVFIMGGRFVSATDHVQVTLGAYTKPGMLAIAERLGNGIQPHDIAVKPGAGLQVNNINGDMVEAWFLRSGHKNRCENDE